MTREDYERRKQRLEEQYQASLELIQAAHRAQVRALELIWLTSGDGEVDVSRIAEALPSRPPEPAPTPPAPAPQPAQVRRSLPEVQEDVLARLGQCPETFDRNDVCQALGYEPDRNSLYKVLRQLVTDGALSVEAPGGGQTPTVYRRL